MDVRRTGCLWPELGNLLDEKIELGWHRRGDPRRATTLMIAGRGGDRIGKERLLAGR